MNKTIPYTEQIVREQHVTLDISKLGLDLDCDTVVLTIPLPWRRKPRIIRISMDELRDSGPVDYLTIDR